MSRPMRPLSRRILHLETPRHNQQHHHQATRAFTTTPPTPKEDSKQRYSSPDPASSPFFETLKEIDTTTLTKTKSQVSQIIATARALSDLTNQILSSAGQVQHDPRIPPYKPNSWTQHRQIAPSRFTVLQSHAERLHQNLCDLESTPYPSDTPNSSPAAKYRSSLATQSQEDKSNELRNLKYLQESDAHRLSFRIAGLEAQVDAVRAEDFGHAVEKAAKRGEVLSMTALRKFQRPVFKRAAEGSVIVKDEDEGSRKGGGRVRRVSGGGSIQGWGATATGKVEVGSITSVGKTKNPFQTVRDSSEVQQQSAEGRTVSKDAAAEGEGSGESEGTTTSMSQPAFQRHETSHVAPSTPSTMQNIQAALENGLKPS
ncbi:hypothetical protein BST61_g1495 [Cercospora zeina]